MICRPVTEHKNSSPPRLSAAERISRNCVQAWDYPSKLSPSKSKTLTAPLSTSVPPSVTRTINGFSFPSSAVPTADEIPLRDIRRSSYSHPLAFLANLLCASNTPPAPSMDFPTGFDERVLQILSLLLFSAARQNSPDVGARGGEGTICRHSTRHRPYLPRDRSEQRNPAGNGGSNMVSLTLDTGRCRWAGPGSTAFPRWSCKHMSPPSLESLLSQMLLSLLSVKGETRVALTVPTFSPLIPPQKFSPSTTVSVPIQVVNSRPRCKTPSRHINTYSVAEFLPLGSPSRVTRQGRTL